MFGWRGLDPYPHHSFASSCEVNGLCREGRKEGSSTVKLMWNGQPVSAIDMFSVCSRPKRHDPLRWKARIHKDVCLWPVGTSLALSFALRWNQWYRTWEVSKSRETESLFVESSFVFLNQARRVVARQLSLENGDEEALKHRICGLTYARRDHVNIKRVKFED